jgi:hypothetical protein
VQTDAEPPPISIATTIEIPAEELAAEYPTVAQLYAGPAGIYRGCGPNSGVCHNTREYPNLRTLGAIVDHIGRPCNQKRDEPTETHDFCERRGDDLRFGGFLRSEIAWIEALDADADIARSWRFHLRAAAPADAAASTIEVLRGGEPDAPGFFELVSISESVVIAPDDPRAIDFTFLPVTEELFDPTTFVSRELRAAGVVGDTTKVQFGDPNRNGVFGAELDARLIKPGDPERSYLMRRLTDPSFGTLMPLANCCYWSKRALRAMWCWIAGLAPDASNALDPIDYASCPPGPIDSVVYPDRGSACESSGMCPVRARDETDEPTWPNVAAVLTRSCAGSTCHVGGTASRFTMPTDPTALYDVIASRVRPGDPLGSELYRRIEPSLCVRPECERMPYRQEPLPEHVRRQIHDWIALGALP